MTTFSSSSQAQFLADVELAAASPGAATAGSEAARCLLLAATRAPREPGAADEGGQFTACEALRDRSAGRLLGTVKAEAVVDVPVGPHIVIGGYVFRTLHGHEPDGPNLINESDKFAEMPSGYELCPHDEVSIQAVREHHWQAQYLVFADGIPRYTAAAAPCAPGNTGGSPPNLARRGSTVAAVANGNSWTFDVIIRKRQ